MSGNSTCVAAGRWQAEKGQIKDSDNPELCTKQTQVRSRFRSNEARETPECPTISRYRTVPIPVLCLLSDTVFALLLN